MAHFKSINQVLTFVGSEEIHLKINYLRSSIVHQKKISVEM